MDPINARLLKRLLRTLEGIERSIQPLLDQNEHSASEYKQSTEKQREHKPRVYVRSVLRLPVAVRRYYETKDREERSPWRIAKNVLEYIGVATAIVLALLTWFTLKEVTSQAISARQQVSIMRGQLEETDRPWIKIVGFAADGSLDFPANAKVIATEIVVTAKNIGRSVALNVSIHGAMTLEVNSTALDRQQNELCSGYKASFAAPVTVFPDDNIHLAVGGAARIPSEMRNPRVGPLPILIPNGARLVSPTFLGCITYSSPSSQVIHHSGFRLGLWHREMLPRNMRISAVERELFKAFDPHYINYFFVGNNIPQTKLIVRRFRSGFDAD